MKKIFYILTAALLLTGCTVDDTAIDNNTAKTVTFTATLAPKGGASRDQSRTCSSFGETQPALAEGKGDATTRAITTGTEGGKEVLTTAWKNNEKVAVYYQTTSGYAKTEATVGTPNADGSAPITATLTGALDGGSVKFVYPASLANDNGDDIDENKLLNNQNGYLRTGTKNISKNFDAATGSGTLSVGAGTAVTSEHIAMENRVCICKIKLSFSNGSHPVSSAGKTLTIIVGNERTYTISSPFTPQDQSATGPIVYRAFETGDVIYVAMLPAVSQRVTFLSLDGSNRMYRFVSNDVDLVAGKFYRNIPLTLTETATANRTLTTNDGVVTLVDGDVLTGTGGANTQLKIADGATVMLNGVTNTGITQEANIPGIECLGDATIILMGTNSVRGREYAPGILVPEGKTLTIMGSGTLNATGGNTSSTAPGFATIGGAGIGGTKDVSCGNIVIKGGTITATGTGLCAGIGSGHANQANTTCGAITISGGTVTAQGGQYAAGIGSGNGHAYDPNGSGNPLYYPSFCGVISITGGTVTATGGVYAAGIGSGWNGRFASISIGSGITSVTATRSNDFFNVPIGKGYNDRGSGAVTFGGVTMHDGRNVYRNPSDWTHWPETGGPFGGIQVSASDYGSENGRTWTLTPAP